MSDTKLSPIFSDYFKAYQDVSLISQSELEGLSSAKSGRDLSLAREAGQQLNYGAVLVTSVKRYQERDGSEYAVTPCNSTTTFPGIPTWPLVPRECSVYACL